MSAAAAHNGYQPEDSEILRLLRETVATFARRGGITRSRQMRGKWPGMDADIWKEMADQGWLGVLIPEGFGGQGLGFAEMAVIVEELAKAAAPEPVIGSSVLSACLLIASNNDPLKAALLPKIASGESVVGTALTRGASEKGGVSVKFPNKAATLNGVAHHVYPALSATDFIVAAEGPDGLSLHHIGANATGLSVRQELRVDGTFAGTLIFEDVASSALVAQGEMAELSLQRAIDAATVMTCAELFGNMQESLEITLNYLRTRVQFDRPIGSFQALQHRAVDLWIQKELSLVALNDALRILDNTNATADQVSVAASRAKSRLGDAAHIINREAVNLHGAIGVTDEYDLGLYLRRAITLNAWLGTPSEHRRRYGELFHRAGGERDERRTSVPFSAVFLQDDKVDVGWNSFSDEEFRAGVFAWFDKNYPHDMRHMGRRGSADEMREWMKRIARKGWIAPAWPVEWGGMGLSPAKQIIFIEERERIGVMRNPDMGVVMFGPMLMRWGTEEQKQRYLPKIITNEQIWCQGYSEPNAGSDLASLKTTAVLDGDHWVINGSKIWTSSGHWADHMFLLARTDKNAKKQEGITFFVLDMKTPGVTVRPIMNIAGHEEFAQEYLDNVRVPKENVVGEVNQGWTVAKSLLGFERLNSGSPRPARAALAAVEKVAKSTGAWDDPVFQAKYIRLHLDISDLSSAYQRFADLMSLGDNPGPELSQLKIIAASASQLASELLMEAAGGAGANVGRQDFGGSALDVTGPFFSHFTSMIASGTNDIQRNIIAKRVLKLP